MNIPEMSISERAKLYGIIHRHLFNDEDEYVNNYLQSIDMKNTDTVTIMGLARLTSMMKERLSYWDTYVKLGYEEIKLRGLDADEIYRGLIHESN